MEDTESRGSRDYTFALMRHAVLTSPSTNRLVTHLLVIVTNILTALALALVMVAFFATLLIQCFSIVCVIEKFFECFNETCINMGARLISFLLLKTCFSRGSVGERERMAVGGALVRVAVGCWWSSFAYSVPSEKLYGFYQSWSFFTIVIAQVWLQLLVVRVEEMFRRGQSSREGRRERATCSVMILLTLGLLVCLISIKLSKDASLMSLVMLRDAVHSLNQGVVVEKLTVSLMGNENSYAYDDSSPSSSQHRKLSYEVYRLLLQVTLDSCVILGARGSSRTFLFLLLAVDVIALSDPLIKMTDIAMYERHLKRKYPRLTAAEFSAVPKEETCPVCLECHTLQETVKLPCGHLVHSSCVLSMARVAAANSRRHRAGLQYPLSSSAHRCPVCRATLSFDSSSPAASDDSPAIAATAPNYLSVGGSASPRLLASPPVLSANSLGSEMIRSTFGGMVLAALTTRQTPAPASEGAGEGSLDEERERAQYLGRVADRVPPRASIRMLERQNGFRAAVSSASSGTSTRSAVSGTPAISSAQRSAGGSASAAEAAAMASDANLHAVLDYWYPAQPVPLLPPTSSSSSSSTSPQEVVALAVADDVTDSPAPDPVRIRGRKRGRSVLAARAPPDEDSPPGPRVTRTRSKSRRTTLR